MKTIYPLETPSISQLGDVPLFFLAGPVGGGHDWQSKACEIIEATCPESNIAIPWPRDREHRFMSHRAYIRSHIRSERQLEWERRFLKMAAKEAVKGCVIFWLPEESRQNPRIGAGSYAMDTRRELGEFYTRVEYDKDTRVVVGAELSFPGLSVIQRCFSDAAGYPFEFGYDLERTIAAAIAKAAR